MNNRELVLLLRKAACRADIKVNGMDRTYVVARISTVIDALEKAAEGVDPVAVVIDNVVGVSIAWCKGPSEGRPPPGTRLYTTPPAPAVSVPDVWQLVPVKPTKAMRMAFHEAHEVAESVEDMGSPDFEWQAMLAAAPQPESSE